MSYNNVYFGLFSCKPLHFCCYIGLVNLLPTIVLVLLLQAKFLNAFHRTSDAEGN